MTVEFRLAGPDDEPFLTEMLRLAMGWRDGSRPPLTAQTAAYVRGFGARDGDRGVVAFRGAAPVGAAWYRRFAAADATYGFVRDDVPELSLAVDPGARRLGVATGLLTRLIAEACEQGLAGMSLSVEPDNAARSLYERLGFAKVGERAGAWTMVRALGA
ncbi:MAG: GNAT family N-acetyltransferase [Solirubrobacterales bacterium]|nr:GNAT family N-acetyltransferase [Solirubrobacterales bacterium]